MKMSTADDLAGLEGSSKLWIGKDYVNFIHKDPVDVHNPFEGNVKKKYMNHVVRKPAFSICENKGADQLRGNREADQRLCFRYTDSTIPLLPKSEISSL